MKASQVFLKTMPFCMAKFALGGIMILICGLLLAILMGIGWLFGEVGVFIGFLAWMASLSMVHLAVMQYAGYLVKAGHMAVIAEATTTGKVPENQVKYGVECVKSRFLTSNIYFAVDKLVSGAVKEIQKGIQKVENMLDFIPGMDKLAAVAKFFVELFLGYIDECCLGYTFYKKEQGAFQSACDGVVIYAQNIVHLLKNAAMTMLKVVGALIVVFLLAFVPVGILFRVMNWNSLIALALACLVAWVIKFAFLDSFILCQTMAGYMAVAPGTEIAFDLYGTISGVSSSFKELWEKGVAENPAYGAAPAEPVYAAPAAVETAAPVQAAPAQIPESPSVPAPAAARFCGQCGAKNETGAAFCGACGARL